MKQLKFFIASIMMSQLTIPVAVSADWPYYYIMGDEESKRDVEVAILRPRRITSRPRAPFRNPIECLIEVNKLIVVVPTNLKYVKFQIEYEGKLIYDELLTGESSEIYIDMPSGEYSLVAIDNSGLEYEGSFMK